MVRTSSPDLAAVAAVLASEARASMVLSLLDGRAWTLSELAQAAGVARSTASEHLNRLVESHLVLEVRQGRHRYVRIAGQEVAETVEALAALGDGIRPAAHSLRAQRADLAIREGRSCYRHLAGRVGVALCDGLRQASYVAQDWTITTEGRAWFADIGVELPRSTGRPLVRPCLDWTERREHLAGVAADALFAVMCRNRWIEESDASRAVRLTQAGREAMREVLPRT